MNPGRARHCKEQIQHLNELRRAYPLNAAHFDKLKQHYLRELAQAEGVANDR